MSINENTVQTESQVPQETDWSSFKNITDKDFDMFEAAMNATDGEFFTYEEPLNRVFSHLNHPFNDIFEDEGPPRLTKLVRHTNNWQFEFGEHPDYFANLTDEDTINRMIEDESVKISALAHVELIACPGGANKYKDLKSRVVRYIVHATEQLNQLQLAGELTFTKKGNTRVIYFANSEVVTLEFLLCDITGYLHTIISQTRWIVQGTLSDPSLDTPTIRSFRRILREVLDNKQRHFYTSLEVTSPRNVPKRASCEEIFSHGVESIETPAWVDDTTSDWYFPETEPFKNPGIIYLSDILSKLTLELPSDLPPSPPKLTRERSIHPPEDYESMESNLESPCPQLVRQHAEPRFNTMNREDYEEMRRADNEYYFEKHGIRPINWNHSERDIEEGEIPELQEIRICDFCDNLATTFNGRELCDECVSDTLVVYEEEEPPYKKQRIA